MITLPLVYILVGFFFAAVSLLSLLDNANTRRLWNFLFWGLLATSFLAGNYLGDLGNGLLALGLVLVATIGLGQGKPATTTSEQRRESALSRGDEGGILPLLLVGIGERCLEASSYGESFLGWAGKGAQRDQLGHRGCRERHIDPHHGAHPP